MKIVLIVITLFALIGLGLGVTGCGVKGALKTPAQIEVDKAKKAQKAQKAKERQDAGE